MLSAILFLSPFIFICIIIPIIEAFKGDEYARAYLIAVGILLLFLTWIIGCLLLNESGY